MPTDAQDDDCYEICIQSADDGSVVDPDLVVRAVRLTLRAENCPRCELSVALVDDERMTQLHDRYLNINAPTDVLTFDLSESDAGESNGIDGEIVVSVDTARREAEVRCLPPSTEILLYVIHGVLHLLGYDDTNDEQSAIMHAREDALLSELGLQRAYEAKAQ